MKSLFIIISPCNYTRQGLVYLVGENMPLYVFSTVHEAESLLSRAQGFLLFDMNNIPPPELTILVCLLRTRMGQLRWNLCALGDVPVAKFIAEQLIQNQDLMLSVYQSKHYLAENIRNWLRENVNIRRHVRHLSLSKLESRSLQEMAEGKRLTDIARLEGKCMKTINAFQTRALKKLGLNSPHDFRLLCSGRMNKRYGTL